MKPEENYKDDMEYLSQQGFEKVKVNEQDLLDLKKRIKGKSRAFSRFYSGLAILGTGILAGALLFFLLDKKESDPLVNSKINVIENIEKVEAERTLELDTVVITKENFINPVPQTKVLSDKKELEEISFKDSADIIIPKPIDLSLLSSKGIKEEKLKFMINSPVFYLHDLKVTNYTTLYFKSNRFIPFSGTSAAYSTAMENSQVSSHLKESADYFLHEEIAQAMLYFKKAKYDQAINSLNLISTYNTEDLNCDFYLAMSYYYKKNYAKAIDLFNLCIGSRNNSFFQEASYYKAVSIYESGDVEQARVLFKKIMEENEFYAEKAKSFLKG